MKMNPRKLGTDEIISVVQSEVRGCLTLANARRIIDRLFSPKVLDLEVKAKGEFQVEISLKPYNHQPYVRMLCNL